MCEPCCFGLKLDEDKGRGYISAQTERHEILQHKIISVEAL